MNLDEIKRHPTCLEPKEVEENIVHMGEYLPSQIKEMREKGLTLVGFSCTGWHESLLRSYHIVQYIKWFLSSHSKIEDTSLLLGLIAFLEDK